MKKISLLLLLVVLFVACEGPEGAMGPIGPKGETNCFTKTIKIEKRDWRLAGNPGDLNSFFYVDKIIPELTRFIYEEGTVLAYIESEKGIKNGLPFVLHRADKDGKGEYFWTQTFDFDFYTGGMSFYFTYSDFSTWIEPGEETFHIIFMW